MESSSSSDSADDEVIDAFPNFHDCNTHDDVQQSSSTTSPDLRPPENDSDNEISVVEQSDSSRSDINEDQDSWVTSVSPRPPPSKTNEEASSVVTALDNNDDDDDDGESSVGGRGGGGGSQFHESEEADSNLLIHVAAFVIKAIGFQFNLLFTMVAFPFWCFSTFMMFFMDPFSIMARGRNYLIAKLLTACYSIWKKVNPFGFFGDRKSISELAWKLSVGLFWSIYVCSLLLLLLVSAIVITGFMMRFLAVEPVLMEERLNFDYTKNSPVAYMPIAASCGGTDTATSCGHKYCQETVEIDRKSCARIIPPNRKLFATLKLTLPESVYNRNLGMFQVRVELLSGNGETVSRSSHPCMLPFRSEPIRVLMTMLKLVPLIAGYISESQTITVQLRGLVEHNNVASTCVKVVVEQRAQFLQSGDGSGIPEIYDAWLILEAELPLLKRLVWNWRRTTFVWTTMVFFIMELLLMLICCRPLFLPTLRPR